MGAAALGPVASIAALAHSEFMSGSTARKRPLLDRRSFLLGFAWTAPALSLLTIPGGLFALGRKNLAKMRIKHHCPGGEVEVLLSDSTRGATCALEVRRDTEAAAIVADTTITVRRCSLTLDLPDPRWRSGIYWARTRIMSAAGAPIWESPWKHAFTLRPMPWDG